jgi:dienelactone hydrolase
MTISRRDFERSVVASLCGAASCAAQQPAKPAKEVPWLAEVQRPPDKLPADAPQLGWLDIDIDHKPLNTPEIWQLHRRMIRDNWTQFVGLWDPPRRPIYYQFLETDRVGNLSRRLISYQTEPGVTVEAYLIMPRQVVERLPAVVVFHSTVDYTIRQGAGLEGPPEAAWGLRLAERGFVVLCPRCFLWDDGPGVHGPQQYAERVSRHRLKHPMANGMGKMLYDARRAVDLLASLQEVDAARIGAAGHSLGAKETLYLAALDERIKAAVASEGGIGVRFSNWEAPWYLGSLPAGHDHHELLALAAPRPLLVIGGESADGDRSWPYIDAALPYYRFYGGAPRLGLFNHRQGHTIPPFALTRTLEWLQTYL